MIHRVDGEQPLVGTPAASDGRPVDSKDLIHGGKVLPHDGNDALIDRIHVKISNRAKQQFSSVERMSGSVASTRNK